MAALNELRTIVRSMAGGELSPQLLGRGDDLRYATATRQMQNFVPNARGPAMKRFGEEHAARTKGDAPMRLEAFRFSATQQLAVGIGAGFFRFYVALKTVLFADVRTASSIDTALNVIVFTDPHGFVGGEQVRTVAIDAGGVLPNPLDDLTIYSVQVIDAWRIRFAAITLTTTGTGALRLVPSTQMLLSYVSSKPILSVNMNTNEIVFGIDHYLETGDPFVFTSTSAPPGNLAPGTTYYARKINNTTIKVSITKQNALDNITIDLISVPSFTVLGTLQATGHTLMNTEIVTIGDGTGSAAAAGLTAGVNYFVVNANLNAISVSLTLNGAPVNLTNIAGTLFVSRVNARMHFAYENGDQVYLRTAGKGFYACVQRDPRDNTPGAAPTYWHRMGDDGELELRNGFVESNLFSIDVSQSGNVMTLVHGDFSSMRLERLSATRWKFETALFAPPLAAPTGLQASRTRGARLVPVSFTEIDTPSGKLRLNFDAGHGLGDGVGVYVEGFASQFAELTDGFYTGALLQNVGSPVKQTMLRKLTGQLVTIASIVGAVGDPPVTAPGTLELSGLLADTTNSYKVTALDQNRVESQPSAAVVVTNNLLIDGTKNTLSWTAVTGALRYRVYKKWNGLFGMIGETDALTFDDTNIAAKLDATDPQLDTTIQAGRPQAVAHADQRLALGGFASYLQRVALSRPGAELDFSVHIPVRADDRVSLDLTLDGSPVRHLLALDDGLIVFTTGSVLMLEPVGDEAIGPETTRERRLARKIGAAEPQPLDVNDRALFVSASGQHVHEVAPSRKETPVQDLCVRANHLFDGYTIKQLASIQSPFPLVCAVRSDGVGLILSYMPAEEVLGWAPALQIAGATIESVCGIRDGSEDAFYVVVKRGSTRSVGRIQAKFFLDDAVRYDGSNNTAATVTLTEGISWGPGDSLLLTSSVPLPAAAGDFVDVIADAGTGVTVRLLIEQVVTGLSWRVRAGALLPTGLQGVAVTDWKLGRARVRTHIISQAVTVVADGVVVEATTDALGFLVLTAPAIVIQAGRRYTGRIKTLPVLLQQDPATGKGVRWNVAHVHAGVVGGAFTVGPKEGPKETVTPVEDEERILMPGKWTEDGVIEIESTEPTDLEVRYLVLTLAAA